MIAAFLLLFSGYCSPRQRWPRGGVVAIVALLLWGGAQAQTASAPTDAEVQPIPALSGRVIDQTGDTLSIEQRQALSRQLAEVEAQTGSQMVILLVKRTAPEDIAAYAWRVADAWKIGRRDVGDGVLLWWLAMIGASALRWPKRWKAPSQTWPLGRSSTKWCALLFALVSMHRACKPRSKLYASACVGRCRLPVPPQPGMTKRQ